MRKDARKFNFTDIASQFDWLDGAANAGLAKRRERTRNSPPFEMLGPLHVDFSSEDHFLLNNVELRIKLT